MRRPPVEVVDPDAVDEKDVVDAVLKDVIDEYAETSERLEVVRVSGVSGENDSEAAESGAGEDGAAEDTDVRGRGARDAGGTS